MNSLEFWFYLAYKTPMQLFANARNRFFLQLILGLLVFSSQTLNLEHDLEHKFHEPHEFCAIYLVFENHSDAEAPVVIDLDSIRFVSFVDRADASFPQSLALTIRGPPQNLLS